MTDLSTTLGLTAALLYAAVLGCLAWLTSHPQQLVSRVTIILIICAGIGSICTLAAIATL